MDDTCGAVNPSPPPPSFLPPPPLSAPLKSEQGTSARLLPFTVCLLLLFALKQETTSENAEVEGPPGMGANSQQDCIAFQLCPLSTPLPFESAL